MREFWDYGRHLVEEGKALAQGRDHFWNYYYQRAEKYCDQEWARTWGDGLDFHKPFLESREISRALLCGTSSSRTSRDFFEFTQAQGIEPQIIDQNEQPIQASGERFPEMEDALLQVRGENMPFEEETFDWITSDLLLRRVKPEVMSHLFENFKRVLSPGGVVTITLDNDSAQSLAQKIKSKLRVCLHQYFQGGAYYMEDHAEIRALAKKAGLQAEIKLTGDEWGLILTHDSEKKITRSSLPSPSRSTDLVQQHTPEEAF